MSKIFSFQIGGRHQYAIPEALSRHRLLSLFLTDFVVNRRTLNRFQFLLPKRISKRLHARSVSNELYESTLVSRKLTRQLMRKKDFESPDLRDTIAKEVIHKCPSEAEVFVGLFLEALSAFKQLREKGLQTVMEVYIAPHTARLVSEENQRYPEVADGRYDRMNQKISKTWGKAIEHTDHFICPSQFVAEGLGLFGAKKEKISIIPYGVPTQYFGVKNHPTPKKILFVGTADIRKGIHYLIQAAEQLSSQGFDFHVIGTATKKVQQLLERSKITYHGQLSRHDTLAEYASADIFVLPSIAEGSATVIFEAMAVGIPVVTTENSGSVIRHEQDGIIVPIRNVTDFCSQIKRIGNDRKLRTKLSVNAKNTSQLYQLGEYGDRFAKKISTIVDSASQRPSKNGIPLTVEKEAPCPSRT